MFLIIRERQVKTQMRYYLISVRMTIIRNYKEQNQQDMEKLEPLYAVGRNANGMAAGKQYGGVSG